MIYKRLLQVALLLLASQCLFAQGATTGYRVHRVGVNDDVRLFQNFIEDAARSEVTYGQGLFGYADFDYGSLVNLGVNAGLPVSERVEVGGEMHFLNLNPEMGESQSGISDVALFGKYLIPLERTQLLAGGYLTLPIGNEDVGQGNFNFGAFGSLRHPLTPVFSLSGTLGLNFLEIGNNRETSLKVAGGLIYSASPDLNFIGELNLETQNSVGLLSGGVDYQSGSNSHFRAVLGLGVDDGSPDLLLQVSFLTFLNR